MITKQRIDAYWRLARLDRPIGTFLLLWPCLMALFLAADGMPDLKVLLVFTLGVFVMRACGCVINDYADRKVDGHVTRTKMRPIVSGEISPKAALIFFALLAVLAFILVLQLNLLVIQLSFVGIALTIAYPFMKRLTHMPQMFLGIVWSWSIPMAYAAQLGDVPAEAWWLFAANWCWTVAYDTMYAMVDRDDDIKVGIKSTAILFGQQDRFYIGCFQIAALLCFMMAGWQANLGLVYAFGILTFCGFSLYQQHLIADRQRDPCLTAFLNNNWAGMGLCCCLVLDFLWL